MITRLLRRTPALVAATVITVAGGGGLRAQETEEPTPLSNFILAGYGSATYDAVLGDEFTRTRNDFTAAFSPVILYSMGRDLLFEAELEFGLSGELTTTTLEYAQVDYLGFEKLQFTAGKFLLPFGLFSERLHPTWINRLPVMPLVFGHAHGGVAEASLLPVLSDAGAMGRYSQPLGSGNSLNLSVFVTQGPRLMAEGEGADGHAHSVVPARSAVAGVPGHEGTEPTGASPFEIPDVGFGVAFADNNENKMIGGRVGYVRTTGMELYASAFHAMYDAENYLDYTGVALSAQVRKLGFDLLGEAVHIRQEFPTGERTFETVEKPGYYVEVARRVGAFEPVARWSQLLDGEVDGTTAQPGTEQLSLGLTYWTAATAPLKAAYVLDPDLADRIVVQWAFGF